MVDIMGSLSSSSKTIIHQKLYPFTFFSTLHAARVALVYNSKAQTARVGKPTIGRVTLRTEIAGFLIAAWGGTFIVHPILASDYPPPILSIYPFLNYLSIFLLVRALPQPRPWLLDISLPALDGLTRSTSVITTMSMCQAHINPVVKESVLFQTLLGAIAAGGGGLIANTLDVFSGEWKFVTPSILTGDIWTNWDLLLGALASVVYSLLTSSDSTWTAIRNSLDPSLLSLFGIPSIIGSKDGTRAVGTRNQKDASGMVMVVLVAMYAFKAYMVHWHSRVQSKAVPAKATRSRSVIQEKKLQ